MGGTGLEFIHNTLLMLYDFFFNQFRLPWTSNTYIGWVVISFLVMGMTIKSLLNVARGIAKPSKLKIEIRDNRYGQ